MLLQQFNIENSKSWRNITSFRKWPIEETEIYVIGFSGRGWGTTQTWNHGDLRTNQGGIQLHSEPVSLVSTLFSVIVEFGLVVFIIPNGQIITIKMLWSDGCWVKSLKDQIVRTFKTSRIFPLNSFNFTLNLECGKYQLLKTFVTTIAFVSEGLWLYIILFGMLSFNSIWLMDVEVMFLNIRELEMFLNFKYFRLKLECEKLAQEKTEMQRHYVMVSFLINLFRSSSGFKLKRGKLNIEI